MALEYRNSIAGPGARFPEMEFNLVSGERVVFPGQSGGISSVLLVYCGHG